MPERLGSVLGIVVFLVLSVCEAAPPIPDIDYRPTDDFSYSTREARAAWAPMTGTGAVSVVDAGGGRALRMPCNFRGTKFERASWDRNFKMDLTMCRGLQFLFHCPDSSGVASFTMYLHSGDGWYRAPFEAPVSRGWNPVKIHKEGTGIEGRPGGWGQIDTIRISAWRGRDVDTEFYIAALGPFGHGTRVVIVRGDSVAGTVPGEVESVKRYADVMAQFLDRAGIAFITLSDLDVTAERLKRAKLVILPHNPSMPAKVADEIGRFLEGGGKLLACYTLPNRLESVVGIRSGPHVGQRQPGHFASIRPSKEPLEGSPAITKQASWNIHRASAVRGRSRVAAYWYDNKGQSTNLPAIVVSDNCVYLTHVLIADDAANKMRLLLAMVGSLSPELWREAAEGRIDRIGRLGPYEDYETALQGIRKLADQGSGAAAALEEAGALRNRARALVSAGKFSEAVVSAEQAQESMVEAYCVGQKPLASEHRAFWCHSAFGVAGMSWDEAIERLAENGFTAILPNMLWAGAAFYKSDVLPVASSVAEKGDQIELCLAACKKYGIECHVWKVNYNMGWATDAKFVAKMKAQGRTQVNFNGTTNERWLCPSHPENRKLEIESVLEIARKYDVDGLHFDYIRYPGRQACFCSGCRRRFERAMGAKVKSWPADVRNNKSLADRWLDFRRGQITSVVAAVAERARQIRPGIKISAAVFRNWPVDRDAVGQDWKLWCDRGYLDFVCPMDYTSSSGQFRRMVQQQQPWAGKVPCYPGIGLSVWPDPTDICKLIEQINITRELRTGGFTIFNYDPTEARETLGGLGKGTTRRLQDVLRK